MTIPLNFFALLLTFGISTGDAVVSGQLHNLEGFVEVRASTAQPFVARKRVLESVKPSVLLNESNSFSRPTNVKNGLFFFDGHFCPDSTLHWSGGRLRIENATSGMLAKVDGADLGEHRSDADLDSPEFRVRRDIEISRSELQEIESTLSLGGVVVISGTGELVCARPTSGGFSLVEAIATDPGAAREKLIDDAVEYGVEVSPESRTWLANYRPDRDLTQRADEIIEKMNTVGESNIVAAKATQRLDSWSYPLTVTAMLIFVLSIGSLLAVRPHELVAVANSESEVSIIRFLWLIVAMSTIDLVWTLLAHQANQISEVNPVGNVMLNDPNRVIWFKCLATILSVGILYRARHSLFARKACWWICLTLSLLIGRWILVAGVSV